MLSEDNSPVGLVGGRNIDAALCLDPLLVVLNSDVFLGFLVPPARVRKGLWMGSTF
jgi:hypothetical protein